MTAKGVNQLDQRQKNAWLIKQHLYLNSPISRVEIAQDLGLTTPVITGMMSGMIEAGLVREIGIDDSQAKGAGRRRVMLEFDPDAFFVCGIDLGPYYTNYVVTDFRGNVVAQRRTAEALAEYDKTFRLLCEQIPDFLKEAHIPMEKLLGIGIGMPGLINGMDGTIYTTFKDGWMDHDPAAELSAELGVKVIVENNVRTKTIGVEMFDRMVSGDPFAYFSVFYGIACQMVIDGKVLYGDHAAAGEIGHMVVQRGGPVCTTCGNHGCLEAVAGERAVMARCRETMLRQKDCCLWNLCDDPRELHMDMVLEAQRQGDPYVEEIMEDVLDYLGIALSNIVNLISPQLVVVDGRMFGVRRNQELMIQSAERNMFRIHRNKMKFVFLPFDPLRGARGAAAVVVKDYLSGGV